MSRAELELAINWAAAEGWNPGLYDGDTFYSADTDGYLAGEVDGEIIATISAVSYGTLFGFIGFYIVTPTKRGQGFGLRLWQAGMKRLEGRNIGLDGVPAQEANYRRSGFTTAYSNIRYEAISTGYPPGNTIAFDETINARIVAFDAKFFPVPRALFLQSWLRQNGSKVLVSLEDGDVMGYGVIRPCRNGFKIGPLFAETEVVADALFRDLASTVKGSPIFLDAPEPNAAATALTKRYDLQPMFATSRMYTGEVPQLPLGKIYGVTSFELG
jgi:hypothetical protein